MASPAPKSMLAGLLQALSGPEPLIILPHDNPDPDALASAAALKYLAQELLEKDVIEEQLIFYTIEHHKKMWRFFDARTYRSGPFDQEYLIALMEQLL